MENEPYILQLYYTSRPLLFAMCAGNEVFYIALYLVNFYDSSMFNLRKISKTLIWDLRFTFQDKHIWLFTVLWKFLAVICFPIAVAKWVIAIYQGVTAAKNLAAIDIAEREAKELKSQ